MEYFFCSQNSTKKEFKSSFSSDSTKGIEVENSFAHKISVDIFIRVQKIWNYIEKRKDLLKRLTVQ